MHRIVIVMMTSLLATVAFAQEYDGGQPGAYARIPVGARAIGLGGAYTAVADGGEALAWNPAGIAQDDGASLSSSYAILDLDRTHMSASVAVPGSVLAYGLHWQRYGVDSIDGRDEAGQPTGSFESAESVYSGGLALSLGFLHLGGAFRYYQQVIGDHTGTGTGYSAGAMLRFASDNGRSKLRIGASVADREARMTWDTAAETEELLPEVYRAGASLELGGEQFSILVAGDYCQIDDRREYLCLGAEITLLNTLLLRAGLYDERYSFGASIKVKTLRIDYAMSEAVIQENDTSTLGIRIGF